MPVGVVGRLVETVMAVRERPVHRNFSGCQCLAGFIGKFYKAYKIHDGSSTRVIIDAERVQPYLKGKGFQVHVRFDIVVYGGVSGA